jgi:D-alanine-D-alanine ligase-like ATP-grasp enzyme
MKFEIERDAIQDMIAMYGVAYTIQELNSAFLAAVETEIKQIFEERSNG